MIEKFTKWYVLAVVMVITSASFKVYSQDGASLFKNKCATCHQIFKDGTGPKLFGVKAEWEANDPIPGAIHEWVRNWQKAAANDPYAAKISKLKPTAMSFFPDLKDEDIDAIFTYIDSQQDPATKAAAGGDGATVASNAPQEEEHNYTLWTVLGIVFLVVVLTLGGVRRQLSQTLAAKQGKNPEDYPTYSAELKAWMWKNKIYVGIVSLIVILSLIVIGLQGLGNMNVMESYQPSQPIAFPHSVHAGINKIDCKYCHNTADKSRTAGIPTVNVCMNCHKLISGNTPEQEAEISKIYKAAGWDGSEYTNKTHPIVWNKVHVLPDHVFFSHEQHVKVGGIDCKQCHGDMTKQTETARVVPVSELNKIEGNIPLTKPTLTMGWCIECHDTKGISDGPLTETKNGYYEEIHKRLKDNDPSLYEDYMKDGKVTVRELGGWECAKCHY